jgi:hypothetical protein
MMLLIVAAAIVVMAALSLHHYHWRHGATGQHVLAVLPAAFLFVLLPIPVLMFSAVQRFKEIGETGGNSYSAAAGLSLEINRGLWLGSVAVVLTMTIAAVLQWRASAAHGGETVEQPGTWRDWVLLACALLAVPTAIVVYIAGEVPRTVIGAMAMVTGSTPAPLAPPEVRHLSARIAGLLVTGFLSGLLLAVVDLFAAAGAVFAARGVRQPRRQSPVAWVMLAIVLLGVTWNGVQLLVERRWIERVAASAAARQAYLQPPHPAVGRRGR